jgi:hypothetical protein
MVLNEDNSAELLLLLLLLFSPCSVGHGNPAVAGQPLQEIDVELPCWSAPLFYGPPALAGTLQKFDSYITHVTKHNRYCRAPHVTTSSGWCAACHAKHAPADKVPSSNFWC